MVSVSEPSPSGTLFPTFHYGALSGAKNAGNRVENPDIQEILIHRGEYHYGISKYRERTPRCEVPSLFSFIYDKQTNRQFFLNALRTSHSGY